MAGLASYKRVIKDGDHSLIGARGMVVVLRNCQAAINLSTIQNETAGKSGEKYTLTLRKGEKWFAAQEFDGVDLENPTGQGDQTVEVLIGYGDYQEPPPNVAVSDAIDGLPNVEVLDANTLIAGDNPRRSRLFVKADVNNAKGVLINDNQGDNSGMLLDPGESITIQSRGEVTGIVHGGVSGDSELIWVLEEVYNVAP